ncbi:biotin/lipoyl-containing protein [Psychrilyobacter sp.]|uniref:biotin/lipoyl-containing protein n=1 Tax=Psychrilyobacter sp. TaxID=2586924 RepID=UPI003015A088
MKNFRVYVNDVEYKVEIEEILEEVTDIVTPKKTVRAAPQPVAIRQKVTPKKAKAAPVSTGGESVTAPMPGTITKIFKSVGDAVSKGETLLILEAMKMENEIRATCDGILTNIHAEQGESVNAGDVLVVLS